MIKKPLLSDYDKKRLQYILNMRNKISSMKMTYSSSRTFVEYGLTDTTVDKRFESLLKAIDSQLRKQFNYKI